MVEEITGGWYLFALGSDDSSGWGRLGGMESHYLIEYLSFGDYFK